MEVVVLLRRALVGADVLAAARSHDQAVLEAAAQRAKARKRFARGRWPILCDAMGVSPEQCEEAEQKMSDRGVVVQYDRETGCPIITSEGQYKRMRRIAGLHHKSSYTE